MADEAAKLAKFNAQFQRSVPSPLAETQTPRLELDGSAVLTKFIAPGSDASTMSGAEFYAMIGHIKRQHGEEGERLEAELMKLSRQKDKRLRLGEWVAAHYGSANPTANAPSSPPLAATMPAMPKLDFSAAVTESQTEQPPPVRAALTARANLAMAGGAMADLLGAPSPRAASGAQTARPSTAPAVHEAPPADMSVIAASYAAGRDHLKMSGGEYYSLVAWLKASGHPELEDMLMKVRMLGEKKWHLVKYLKEKCGAIIPQGGGAPPQAAPAAPLAAPPPIAAVMAPPQQPSVTAMYEPPPQMPGYAPAPPPGYMPAAPPVAPTGTPAAVAMAPGNAAAIAQTVTTLEQTLQRLEESFNFAVECVQTDLAHAKEQLRQLKAASA